MVPDNLEVSRDMGKFLDNFLSNPTALDVWYFKALAALARFLSRFWLTRWAYRLIAYLFVNDMLGSSARVSCPVTTMSTIIDDQQLAKVDLLKVDVERAELDVLRGIDGRHWPLIKQLSVEVHECNRLAVQALLQSAGFVHVVFDQSSDLRGTSIYNCYAKRAHAL